MIDALLAALEASAWARALRESVWLYPLVNAGHILGIALLVGAIVPLDLRLLGAWRAEPLGPLWRVLSRTATAGVVVAVVFGLMLFGTRATEYAASDYFLAKMGFVVLGALNALTLRVALSPATSAAADRCDPPSRRMQIAASISLIAWSTALVLGRLVGYF